MSRVVFEGWPELVRVLKTHALGLSLPEGVSEPIEVIPIDLRYRLWLQVCFDALSGLGQDEMLTLANPEQREYRLEWFISSMKEHKDMVKYFDLTLDTLLTKIIMPPQDRVIFRRLMTELLALPSSEVSLSDFL